LFKDNKLFVGITTSTLRCCCVVAHHELLPAEVETAIPTEAAVHKYDTIGTDHGFSKIETVLY
jgi:hypothetical protein